MADDKKQNSSNSNKTNGSINEGRGKAETRIKSQIPDFKFSAPVPDKPSTTTGKNDK